MVLEGKQGTRVQSRRGGGDALFVRRPGPPLGGICWATLGRPPSSCRNLLLWSVRDGQLPFGLPHHSKVTGPRVYLGTGVGGGFDGGGNTPCVTICLPPPASSNGVRPFY